MARMTDRSDLPLSILDLAIVERGARPRDALLGTVTMAQRAEARGYARVWYAEHHNMAAIASSATSVLIAHVAAETSTIRLGSGGIMLPNHSPLVVAEQFGTLASLHPGRIDLGLGRAPGTDQTTMRALRRDVFAADHFAEDVLELQGFLGPESRIEGVKAIPGQGTEVPIYVLGSSLYGAQLAALLGLPYAFASHFAPQALEQAVAMYRAKFRPSAQCAEPYVIAAVNVIAADEHGVAHAQLTTVRRLRVARFLAPGRDLTDEEADGVLASPQGRQVAGMMQYTAVGTAAEVVDYLVDFRRVADADELMLVFSGPTLPDRLHALDLLADAWPLTA
jgi:luciferase family oxidoreductase group 1